MLTVDDDWDEADEFPSSSCSTCRISTYSSSWLWDAIDDDAAAEINEGFGRLSVNVERKILLKNLELMEFLAQNVLNEFLVNFWRE